MARKPSTCTSVSQQLGFPAYIQMDVFMGPRILYLLPYICSRHLLTWKNLPPVYLKSTFPESTSSPTFPSKAICLATYETQELRKHPDFQERFPAMLAKSLGKKLIHSFPLKKKQTLDSGLPKGLPARKMPLLFSGEQFQALEDQV